MNETRQRPSLANEPMQESLAKFATPDAAEPVSEAELLALMRKHCQKSWQATRWLLECNWPERYGKRKGKTMPGPSVDEVFNAVVGVLTEEIADESLRSRIEARLDRLAASDSTVAAQHATEQHPAEEAKSDTADQQVDEDIDEPHDNRVAADLDDSLSEPLHSHVREAQVGALLNQPARASSLARKRQRQQAAGIKRQRKQRDKDRKKQNKMRSTARKLKKSRRRPP